MTAAASRTVKHQGRAVAPSDIYSSVVGGDTTRGVHGSGATELHHSTFLAGFAEDRSQRPGHAQLNSSDGEGVGLLLPRARRRHARASG